MSAGNVSTSLRWLGLDEIHFAGGNPRSNADEDLEGLAASLGGEDAPVLINPPMVRPRAAGGWQVVAGERRVRAAHLAGWQRILCQVRELDARASHRIRVVENLHRRELNPLDQASALKISWLAANGEALGLGDQVEAALTRELPQSETIAELSRLLAQAGFVPSHPEVTWDEVLDSLGVEMNKASRVKLLRVLSLDPQAQDVVRPLALTEAALRSLGTLEAEDQRTLADELTEEPELARKVRRIARVVRDGSHSLDEALAEARGQVQSPAEIPTPDEETMPPGVDEDRVTDQVIRLLESATSARQAVDELRNLMGEHFLPALAPVWREYAREAIAMLESITQEVD